MSLGKAADITTDDHKHVYSLNNQRGIKGMMSVAVGGGGGGTDMVGGILPKAVLVHVVGGRGKGTGPVDATAFGWSWGGRGRERQ